jgi:hypothetical protein
MTRPKPRHRYRRLAGGAGALAATALLAQLPALADDAGARAYAVTSQSDAAGQTITNRELLTIGSQSGKPLVRVSNGIETASFVASFTSDGEIANDTADPGVICYNMATSLVAAYDKDPKAPVPLYFRFLDKVVAIPLHVQAENGEDGTSTLSFDGHDTGTISNGQTDIPSGLLVRGKIAETRGAIDSAVFDEATVAGSPAQRISGTNCSLTEVPQSIGT